MKYWGKRDDSRNLPRTGSLSLTLAGMETRTTVRFDLARERDELVLGGAVATGPALAKASRVLDAVRALATGPASGARARIDSENDFPTGAGLASSASGLAALAVAAAGAAGLEAGPERLSVLARLGSGSACRSILGGFAEWRPGERDDGEDSHAIPVAPVDHWDVSMLVAVVEDRAKEVPSTNGMRHTRESSPFYDAFHAAIDEDLAAARTAIGERDLPGPGPGDGAQLPPDARDGAGPPTLRWSTSPPRPWPPSDAVRRAREDDGPEGWFTIDAGPNVKVLARSVDEERVRSILERVPGVRRVIVTRPGPGARLVAEEAP